MHFIVVADETYHCCVISKLDDVVGAELGSAVMGSNVKSSGLSTQPCGAPVLSVVVLEVLWPTYRLLMCSSVLLAADWLEPGACTMKPV